MRLEKVTFDEIKSHRFHYQLGSVQKIVMQFVESDMDIAKVQSETWTRKTNGASILSTSIKRLRIGGVKAITHNGNTYLIKTEKVEEMLKGQKK